MQLDNFKEKPNDGLLIPVPADPSVNNSAIASEIMFKSRVESLPPYLQAREQDFDLDLNIFQTDEDKKLDEKQRKKPKTNDLKQLLENNP